MTVNGYFCDQSLNKTDRAGVKLRYHQFDVAPIKSNDKTIIPVKARISSLQKTVPGGHTHDQPFRDRLAFLEPGTEIPVAHRHSIRL
jgi:hypothetical protein